MKVIKEKAGILLVRGIISLSQGPGEGRSARRQEVRHPAILRQGKENRSKNPSESKKGLSKKQKKNNIGGKDNANKKQVECVDSLDTKTEEGRANQ